MQEPEQWERSCRYYTSVAAVRVWQGQWGEDSSVFWSVMSPSIHSNKNDKRQCLSGSHSLGWVGFFLFWRWEGCAGRSLSWLIQVKQPSHDRTSVLQVLDTTELSSISKLAFLSFPVNLSSSRMLCSHPYRLLKARRKQLGLAALQHVGEDTHWLEG